MEVYKIVHGKYDGMANSSHNSTHLRGHYFIL